MPKDKSLKLGDVVTWTSQAGGSTTTKTGSIIEVVVPRRLPTHVRNTSSRNHESYVVRVVPVGKRGQPLKPVTYWPVASLLKLAKSK